MLSFSKKRYLRKIREKHFAQKGYFKRVLLSINGSNTGFSVYKINSWDDLEQYVSGLNHWEEKTTYLMKPLYGFNTLGYLSNVDLVFLDSKFIVKEVLSSVSPNSNFSFDKSLYSTLILSNNMSNYLNINVGNKIQLYKFNQ